MPSASQATVIQELAAQNVAFRDARDWKQFHTPKDLALSLVLEAAEVMEHFQWKSPEEVTRHLEAHREKIGEELVDVFNAVLLMSHDFGIDLLAVRERKMARNAEKYPVEKARGNHAKYTEL